MDTDICMEIEEVSHIYADNLRAVGPINLKIKQGEFVCILGESGCGKSTLLRLLSGLEIPMDGMIKVYGEPVKGPDYQRGLVFQTPALLPWLNVQKNIEFRSKLHKNEIDKDLVHKTIELVGLKGFEKAMPRNLSGGMAQRVAIARAMVDRPNILLLDEPFSALDALTRLKMQQELSALWERMGMTIIFVTHDIDEALSLATRIVVLTPAPGRVQNDIQLDFDFPRKHNSPDIHRLKADILDSLTLKLNQGATS